jgi:hypothetical protein
MQVVCVTAWVTREGNGGQFGRVLYCQFQPFQTLHSLGPLLVAK